MHSIQKPRNGPGGSLNLKSWGHFRCIRFIRFGPGSESNASTDSKSAPRACDSDPTPMQVPFASNASNALKRVECISRPGLGAYFRGIRCISFVASGQGPNRMHLMHLKSWPGGATLDSVDPFDSDQGPHRMHVMNLKPWPWGRL